MMIRIAILIVMLSVVSSFDIRTSFASDQSPDAATQPSPATAAYRSPRALAISSDGGTLYVSDRTARCVVVIDTASRTRRAEIGVPSTPQGLLLSPDGTKLYVAQRDTGTVAVIDTAREEVTSQIEAGRGPTAMTVAKHRMFVCDKDRHLVSVIDLAHTAKGPIEEIPVVREPNCAAVTPDQQHVVITNLLPHGAADAPDLAADVSIIDSSSLTVQATVKLPPGSTAARGVCVSPDGKWAYVVHQLSRFNLPVTQLERGWVNTYALSLIDIHQGRRVATMLLDDLYQGAANPYAVVCSQDGKTLWICHAGVHKISIIDIGLVHELLEGKVPQKLADLKDGTRPNIWVRIQKDPQLIEELANDLTALYIAGAIRRADSGGMGPRALALSPDGKELMVANYYSGSIAILDAESGQLAGTVELGVQPEPDAARRGEMIFHDATRAFQHWHSCASCHPNNGRVDGLRWDFLRDGIGNPKDTPSLLYVDKTPPLNRLGTRENAREGAMTGMLVSHLVVPTEQEVDDLLAYFVSLQPEPSPYLTDRGDLTPAAQRGKALFEGTARCSHCHPAPYFTDQKSYDIGAYTETDPQHRYDTPTLLEAYRTAPYLHDGRSVSIRDVLTTDNAQGLHGHVKGLSEQEIDDLVAYVLSL